MGKPVSYAEFLELLGRVDSNAPFRFVMNMERFKRNGVHRTPSPNYCRQIGVPGWLYKTKLRRKYRPDIWLDAAFPWEETPEGNDYWDKICDRLSQLDSNP